MNADQMYQVLKQLMIPHTFASKYWSGKVFSPNDKQRGSRAACHRRGRHVPDARRWSG